MAGLIAAQAGQESSFPMEAQASFDSQLLVPFEGACWTRCTEHRIAWRCLTGSLHGEKSGVIIRCFRKRTPSADVFPLPKVQAIDKCAKADGMKICLEENFEFGAAQGECGQFLAFLEGNI